MKFGIILLLYLPNELALAELIAEHSAQCVEVVREAVEQQQAIIIHSVLLCHR